MVNPWRYGFVLALALPACDTSVERAGSPQTGASAARALEAPGGASVRRSPMVAAPPSGVYFLLEERGLTVLENGRLRHIDDTTYFEKAIARHGGGLWLEHADGIAVYRGGDQIDLLPGSANLTPEVDTPSGLWAIGDDEVALWNGKAWKRTRYDELGAAGDDRVGIAATADGKAYLLAGQRLHRHDGEGWKTFDLPVDATGAPTRVVVGGDQVYVLGAEQLFRLDGEKLVAAATLPEGLVPARVAADASGSLFLPSGELSRFADGALTAIAGVDLPPRLEPGRDGGLFTIDMQWQAVLRIGADGAIARIPAKGELEFSIDRELADPLTLDGSGRLWLATKFGVAHVENDTVTHWTVGTSPELPARVRSIVAVGTNRVEVPDLGPPRLITISGTLVDDGKQPLAGVTLEMCPEWCLESPGESPCEGQAFVRRATTGADGAFTLAGAPPAKLPVWYQRPGSTSWESVPLDGCCDVPTDELAAGTVVLR